MSAKDTEIKKHVREENHLVILLSWVLVHRLGAVAVLFFIGWLAWKAIGTVRSPVPAAAGRRS